MLGLEVLVVVVADSRCRCRTSRRVIDKTTVMKWERVKKEEKQTLKDWTGRDGAIGEREVGESSGSGLNGSDS